MHKNSLIRWRIERKGLSLQKLTVYVMRTVMQNISVSLPLGDVEFFTQLMKKMGWCVNVKENILDKYLSSRPANIELTDEDILSELSAVRYKK